MHVHFLHRPSAWAIACCIAGFLFCVNAYVHQDNGWNQDSRLALLHSLMAGGTVQIDAFHTRTGDKSFLDGHHYSDKAPGTAFLALPFFAPVWLAARVAGLPPDTDRFWELTSWGAALSVGAVVALGSAAVFLYLAGEIGRRRALIVALAVGIGWPAFPYGTMLMSHGATFGLLMAGLLLLQKRIVPGEGARTGVPHIAGALIGGAACGLAVAGEYTASPAAAVIVLLSLRHGWRTMLTACAGAVPFLLLIPLYNLAAFGSPLSIGYDHLQSFDGMKQGLFGITLIPRLDVVPRLLFGEYRGLFFWSPFLLLAVAGLVPLWRLNRTLCIATMVLVPLQALLISSFPYWHGGYALGPRHLVTLVPFLAIAAGYGLTLMPRLGMVLAGVSALLAGTATVIDSMPPEGNVRPIVTFYAQKFFAGDLAHNAGMELGLPGLWSLLPLLALLVAGIWALFLLCVREDGSSAARQIT